MTTKLTSLEDVRGELERLYGEEIANPESSTSMLLRILAQAKDTLIQCTLERDVSELKQAVEAMVAKGNIRRVV